MRIAAAIAIALSFAAGAAAAQTAIPPSSLSHRGFALRLGELQAQQQAAERQALFEQQRLNALEGQIRTEQAISQLKAQGSRPVLPQPLPGAAAATVDPGQFATIPDSALAASNARVRAAAGNRR
jgi:hypothetical protein